MRTRRKESISRKEKDCKFLSKERPKRPSPRGGGFKGKGKGKTKPNNGEHPCLPQINGNANTIEKESGKRGAMSSQKKSD